MQIDRASAIKLGSFAGVAAVAGACHYFGLGEPAVGLFETALALLGSGAHALVGKLGLDVVHDISERAGGAESARGVQNRDLHRLMGEAIARILEREAERALDGKYGAKYLTHAAAAFRTDWMTVELTGLETKVSEKVSEAEVPGYFTGDAESIKKAPVLEQTEWVALVEKVAGPAPFLEFKTLDYAAAELREHFAFELWEAAQEAWKTGDLAWPALILRLLSLILGYAGDAAVNSATAARQLAELRLEIKSLGDAVGKAADDAAARIPPEQLHAHKEMLEAIREYRDDLKEEVRRGFAEVLGKIAEVKAALDNPRVAPVTEPLINLPNMAKQILARDREAQELLEALRPDGPGMLSIAAPPGFGKSAVFALALRKALPNRDPRQAGLNGIAVLDARAAAPDIASFAQLLGRITGLQEVAARFTSAAAEHPDASLRALFFDFLRQAGKVWLVVENAEVVLASGAPAGVAADFRELLKAWCQADHQAKLLLLTRHALHAAPECHRSLGDVEQALLGGLPEDAAIELLRQRLAGTRFIATAEPLLRRIVQKLHRVPMALEQFAGYLHWNEQGVELNQRFMDQNDLLRLHASEQMEDLLLRMIGETLKLLDAPSAGLLRVVAWASIPVPRSGLLALQQDGAASLTRLVRSNLLLVREGTAAEGSSFDMHPLVREALAEPAGAALDFSHIAQVCRNAGTSEWKQKQFRPALSLFVLAERAARIVGERDDLAGAIRGRGFTLWELGRSREAVEVLDESIAIYRLLVEGEHRPELRNDLARAVMNRGLALWSLGQLEEAVTAHDESIAIYRALVEGEHRQELGSYLARAILNRGSALYNLGRLQESAAAYDESIAIYRALVEGEHRRELTNYLAGAIIGQGNALRGLGRLEEAVAAYDESIAIRRRLVEGEHRQELRNDLAVAVMNRGGALQNLGRLEEAVAAYDESIAIYRVLVEGEHRQELRNELGVAIMNRGNALLSLGRLEKAVAAYDESIAIRRVLVEGEHRQELRNYLAEALGGRGNALDDLGRSEEAVAAFDASIAIRRALVEGEHRQELRNDLARAIMNRGVALWNLGRLEEAVAASDESIAIYRVLVEGEHRQELRNELAMAAVNRGSALQRLGRLEAAVAAYEASIAIYRVLVEGEHRQELRNDLARSLYNMALVREKQGAVPAALEAAREARQLREELVNEGMKHLERDLASARGLEARLTLRSLPSKFGAWFRSVAGPRTKGPSSS